MNMKSIYLIILLLLFAFGINAQTLRLESTIHSISYYVENANSISNKVSYDIKFKETPASLWRKGLDASTFNYLGGNKLFTGSILQLAANTNYTIEVNIIDSLPSVRKVTFTSTITTRMEPNVNIQTLDTLWVKNNGKGSVYSKNNPGAFDTLFKRDFAKIKCGTTILCYGGTYNVGELSYSVNYNTTPCNNENNPIIIASVANELAVFDGSDFENSAIYPNWTLYDTVQKIYRATLPISTSYSGLMLYDTLRLFPYATIYPQTILSLWYRESLSNANKYFGSGYYRNGNDYFIKLANGENPNGKKITVSKFNSFLAISKSSASYNPRFIIKNISIKNYGKSKVNFNPFFGFFESEYDAVGLQFFDIKNTIIDHCKFEFNTTPLYFNGASDSTIIQNCSSKDQTGKWMHGAFKNTALSITGDINWITDNGKYGRSLEKAFVFFETKANYTVNNIIFRNNTIDGIVSGIAGRQLESSPFQDIDIYNNTFANCYDAIDIVGNAANYRVWNNRITNAPIVFSLIPFKENNVQYSNTGPAYIFRNIVDKLPTRNNIPNLTDATNQLAYISYGGCEGFQNKVWGNLLKLQTGAYPVNTRTDIHLYHNTFSMEDSLSYNFYLWKNTWNKIISKNNSYNSKFNVHNFEGVANLPNYPFISISDNYFSDNNKLGVVNNIHGLLSSCKNYNNLDSLDKNLRLITGNNDTNLLKIRGFNSVPNFMNAASGNFNLKNNSLLIDKGQFIPNISDVSGINFNGNAPDIGALESNFTASIFSPLGQISKVLLFPNPSNGMVTIKAEKDIKQYILYDLNGRIILDKKYTEFSKTQNVEIIDTGTKIFLIKIIFINDESVIEKLIKF